MVPSRSVVWFLVGCDSTDGSRIFAIYGVAARSVMIRRIVLEGVRWCWVGAEVACRSAARPAAPEGVVGGPPASSRAAGADWSWDSSRRIEWGACCFRIAMADAQARPQESISADVSR